MVLCQLQQQPLHLPAYAAPQTPPNQDAAIPPRGSLSDELASLSSSCGVHTAKLKAPRQGTENNTTCNDVDTVDAHTAVLHDAAEHNGFTVMLRFDATQVLCFDTSRSHASGLHAS